MKTVQFKRPAFVAMACASAVLVVFGVFALSGQTRAQTTLTLPAACVCSKPVALGNVGEIINCRCETLQCVFAAATPASAHAPALACVK